MQMLLIIALTLSALVGCSLTPSKPSPRASPFTHFKLRDGAWLGPIEVNGVHLNDTNVGKDGQTLSHTTTFLVTVCDGKGIFWSRRADGTFRAAAQAGGFINHSNLENHLIYLENHDEESQTNPDWIETQTMLLIELNAGSLRAQWSRGVSNPLLSEADLNRAFFWAGVGTLTQVARECPRDMMNKIEND